LVGKNGISAISDLPAPIPSFKGGGLTTVMLSSIVASIAVPSLARAKEAARKTGEQSKAEAGKNSLNETENKNFRLAKEWGEKAYNVGYVFVSGQKDMTDEELFSIKGEPLYNVIYE